MLFRDQKLGVIAISQLTHAWISGQLLRAWDEPLSEPLLLAAEQHDLGWIDWEVAPSFDEKRVARICSATSARRSHAPMWAAGVDRALAALGHACRAADFAPWRRYLSAATRTVIVSRKPTPWPRSIICETQGAERGAWARALGFDEARPDEESALVAFVDALSLALCGELKTPLDLEAPDRGGGVQTMHIAERPGKPFEFVLSPWPFRDSELIVEGEARPLPRRRAFADEAAMRSWFAAPERVTFAARLASSWFCGARFVSSTKWRLPRCTVARLAKVGRRGL